MKINIGSMQAGRVTIDTVADADALEREGITVGEVYIRSTGETRYYPKKPNSKEET